MTTLLEHAQRELDLAKVPEALQTKILHVVEAFQTEEFHTGGDAQYVIEILKDVLLYRNLCPLTDDPSEWNFVGGDIPGVTKGIWQNNRRTEAFSHDGGTTYYLLSDKNVTRTSELSSGQ